MCVAPATADAARSPTHSESAAIAKAAYGSPYARLVLGKFVVRTVRVSTHGPWARAALAAKPRPGTRVLAALAVFKRTHGTWTLAQLGTARVGCDIGMPKAVRRDLQLTCPT